MDEPELSERFADLIEAILPDVESCDAAAAAVSYQLAGLAALRDGRLDGLARAAWAHLDRARGPDAAATATVRPADLRGDARWERFGRVWARATDSDDPLAKKFSDLWYRAFLARFESQEAWSRARACIEECRRRRAL
jgi:hypothetical protein